MSVRPPAPPLLRVVASWGIDSHLRPPDAPLADGAWTELVAGVRAHRMEGALAGAVDDGWFPTRPEQRDEAHATHRAAMALCLRLERRLVDLADRLDALDVAWRVLKGSAVAHLDEVDPSRRAFGDLDLLVGGDDLGAVVALLESAGGRRRYRTPSAQFDRRFGKGAAVALPDGTEVDLHRTLALGPYGLAIDVVDLFEPPRTYRLAGRDVPALPDHLRFLHACYHAALGQDPPRLLAVRDVVLQLPDRPVATRALATARRWRGEAVVAEAIRLAVALLGWRHDDDPLVAWALALRTNDRDRRWLAAYAGPDRSSRARTALAVQALPGWGDRVAYARSLVPVRLRPGRRRADQATVAP